MKEFFGFFPWWWNNIDSDAKLGFCLISYFVSLFIAGAVFGLTGILILLLSACCCGLLYSSRYFYGLVRKLYTEYKLHREHQATQIISRLKGSK